MDTFALTALQRKKEEKPNLLRRTGRIPAVYYGKGKDNLHVSLDHKVFKKIFAKAGENTIIELEVEGQKFPVLVHDIQYDPVSDAISHVDLIHVDMEKEVTTSVKVVVTGVSPAVKNLGGFLDVQKHEIKIKCLPKDLIHSVLVDVSAIADYHTSIHVKDLEIPKNIKVLDNSDDTVVTATPPKVEKEEVKPAEAVVPAEGAAQAPGQPLVPGAAQLASPG